MLSCLDVEDFYRQVPKLSLASLVPFMTFTFKALRQNTNISLGAVTLLGPSFVSGQITSYYAIIGNQYEAIQQSSL